LANCASRHWLLSRFSTIAAELEESPAMSEVRSTMK
jgi:hypothetical protein